MSLGPELFFCVLYSPLFFFHRKKKRDTGKEKKLENKFRQGQLKKKERERERIGGIKGSWRRRLASGTSLPIFVVSVCRDSGRLFLSFFLQPSSTCPREWFFCYSEGWANQLAVWFNANLVISCRARAPLALFFFCLFLLLPYTNKKNGNRWQPDSAIFGQNNKGFLFLWTGGRSNFWLE